jgi:AraC-like DNA-binding protein
MRMPMPAWRGAARPASPSIRPGVLNFLAARSRSGRVGPEAYREAVLTAVTLAQRPDFQVRAVTCREHHARWSEPEMQDGHLLVLVRRGRFRRRADGYATDLDPSVGYLSTPGQEEHFAHPHGGDVCTAVALSTGLWAATVGEGGRTAPRHLYIDARIDLAHRRMLIAARAGDVDYALAEQLVGLLTDAVRQSPATTCAAASDIAADTAVRRRDRALVDAARTAILEDHPAARGLLPLAELLGVSPYRLSRAFPRELGVTLTGYRGRMRLGRVLDRLEQGERELSALAAELGYADQAHLCRTVRRHLGHTPTSLRSALKGHELKGHETHGIQALSKR